MAGDDPHRILVERLADAQARGFIGPGPLQPHIDHSVIFIEALALAPEGAVVDLGSGAGLPALPVALSCPDRTLVLVESHRRRARHLLESLERLGLGERVTVVNGRAEVVVERYRGTAAAVTARAFGPPATVAECAAPYLAVGGLLVVSEPPGDPDPRRWNQAALASWGQALGDRLSTEHGAAQLIEQVAEAPDWLPRREGAAATRPAF